MPTAPRTVTGNVATLTGEARAGIKVTFTRTGAGDVFGQYGDVVVNEPITVTSGEDGAISVTLLPGEYTIRAVGGNGPKRCDYALTEDGSTDLAEGIDAAAGLITPSVQAATEAARDEVIATQTQLDSVSITTSRSLALTDAGKMLTATSASNITVTIPTDDIAFPVETIIALWRIGAGTVTIAAASGVTLVTTDGLFSLAPGATAVIYKIGANSWAASGYFA